LSLYKEVFVFTWISHYFCDNFK